MNFQKVKKQKNKKKTGGWDDIQLQSGSLFNTNTKDLIKCRIIRRIERLLSPRRPKSIVLF